MYIIESEQVFKFAGTQVSYIKQYIGQTTQANQIAEKTYQWQNFNIETGQYEDDITNTNIITVNGIEYTPVNGRIVIQ